MEARATMNASDVMAMQFIYSIINKAEDEVSSLTGKRIRLIPHAEDIKDDVSSIMKKDLELRQIICQVTGIRWERIASKHRDRELVNARFMYCVFIKQRIPSMTLKAIGENIGGRDHTSVIHALSTVNDLIASKDETITDLINKINLQILEHESKA